MRILVISDIHANYTALEAVLEDAGTVDETWCLGDMVGYGPDPNAVLELIREIPSLTCLLGNHDVAVIGRRHECVAWGIAIAARRSDRFRSVRASRSQSSSSS